MTQYKYYFRKPKSEITKDIFKWLATASAICIAATSPYFSINLTRNLGKWRQYKRRNVYDAFYNLRKQGCINIVNINHQVRISLTEEGKKKAGWLQIDALKIKKPKRWDGNWRLVIFDIAQLKKLYRDSFRGKLKELGFSPLQKSIWVHPFECGDEIELLRNFFGLSEKELRLVIAKNIGDDGALRKLFKVEL